MENDIDIKLTVASVLNGQEVELTYTPQIADQVIAIEEAAAKDLEGIIQACDAVALFPGRPELHTTMREYTALVAAGCVPQEGK